MRTILFMLAMMIVSTTQAQTSACGTNEPVIATEWQEFAKTINQQTACIHELQGKIVKLEAGHTKLQQNVSDIVVHYDTKLRFELGMICDYNSKIEAWKVAFLAINLPIVASPISIGTLTCPTVGSKFYQPQYMNVNGPPIPPQ